MGIVGPGGPRTRQQPERTSERRLAGRQRALRWTPWLAFLGSVIANSQTVRFTGAAIYGIATGRMSVGDVLRDVAIFAEGRIAELIAGVGHHAELEETHAYALFLLLFPGLVMLWLNLIPLLNGGRAFRMEADGSVLRSFADGWEPLLKYQYSTVSAGGTSITFTPPQDGSPTVLPQAPVSCRENGATPKDAVSVDFFRELLVGSGFQIQAGSATTGTNFTARRT